MGQASDIDSSVPGSFSLTFQELSPSHVNMYLQDLAGLSGLNGLECHECPCISKDRRCKLYK